MSYIKVTDRWPEAVSDGLTLPCGVCNKIPQFDFMADDEAWRRCVPEEHRLGVVCLPCFDKLAVEAGVTHNYLIQVHFVSEDRTFDLKCDTLYDWRDFRNDS